MSNQFSSVTADSEAFVRAKLRELTGFEHAEFFQSGTAALEAIFEIERERNRSILIPALGCWTLSYAASKMDLSIEYGDVDPHWALQIPPTTTANSAVFVDPWGAPADWSQPFTGLRIADMTLAPGARLNGKSPGAYCDVGIISLGAGKPLSLGGGGIALFNSEARAKEARALFRFGFEDGQWKRRIERYSFSSYLFAPLADKMRALSALTDIADASTAARSELAEKGFASNHLRDGGQWGYGTHVPLALHDDYPLTPKEIENVAVASGVPLSRHPITPAYLQAAAPVGRGEVLERTRCPRSEQWASRLVFYESDQIAPGDVLRFLALLEQTPNRFKIPYDVPKSTSNAPADMLESATRGRVVRDIEGRFGLLEEANNLLWPLTDDEAAELQAIGRD